MKRPNKNLKCLSHSTQTFMGRPLNLPECHF